VVVSVLQWFAAVLVFESCDVLYFSPILLRQQEFNVLKGGNVVTDSEIITSTSSIP
jgi:hypothetical protein